MNEKLICYNCFREKAEEGGACPYCGYDPSGAAEEYPLALPHGSVLNGRYILGRVLGQGGFGITYVAKDYKTDGIMAVKEYLPDEFATRTGTHEVTSYVGERRDNFEYGKECFLKEAETLAKFIGNDNIVRIHSYFEENGTAYFVMDYVEGESFQKYIRDHGGKIGWRDAERVLLPIMDALDAVHAEGIIHRDVTPDNIFITKSGGVKLLDFGAARYSLGDKSCSLDIVLKHGFAPKEQYSRHGKQGPYTDVYSLAASYYYAITGVKPPESIERMDNDKLVPPSGLGVEIPPAKEAALLQGLNVNVSGRFATMGAFRRALDMPAPSNGAGQRIGQTSGQAANQTPPAQINPTSGQQMNPQINQMNQMNQQQPMNQMNQSNQMNQMNQMMWQNNMPRPQMLNSTEKVILVVACAAAALVMLGFFIFLISFALKTAAPNLTLPDAADDAPAIYAEADAARDAPPYAAVTERGEPL